jgi:hypothetical protein
LASGFCTGRGQTEHFQEGHAPQRGTQQYRPKLGIGDNIPDRGDTGLPTGQQPGLDRFLSLGEGLMAAKRYDPLQPVG